VILSPRFSVAPLISLPEGRKLEGSGTKGTGHGDGLTA
jgi:hypothetical protein